MHAMKQDHELPVNTFPIEECDTAGVCILMGGVYIRMYH